MQRSIVLLALLSHGVGVYMNASLEFHCGICIFEADAKITAEALPKADTDEDSMKSKVASLVGVERSGGALSAGQNTGKSSFGACAPANCACADVSGRSKVPDQYECAFLGHTNYPSHQMALPPPDPQFVLRGTSAAVHTLHFSCGGQEPDVPILFSGSENGLIHVWNLKTYRVDAALDGHGRKSVYCVETMGGKNRLLSQGRDQRICLWDLAEGRTAVMDSVFMENVGFCRCTLLMVAQERWLMAMAAKALEEVQVLELPSKTSVCTLKPEAGAKLGMPMCLKLWQLSDGSQPLLLAGYEDGSVVLWNLSMGKALSQLACHQEPVMSLDFDSEKAKGISGSSEKVLSIWSLNEQQNLQVYKTHNLVNAGISDITIRPDKKIVATAGWDHRIRIFGWKKLKPLAVLDYHTATVHCVSFSNHQNPRERLLAAGSKDHRISIWSIYTQT